MAQNGNNKDGVAVEEVDCKIGGIHISFRLSSIPDIQYVFSFMTDLHVVEHVNVKNLSFKLSYYLYQKILKKQLVMNEMNCYQFR